MKRTWIMSKIILLFDYFVAWRLLTSGESLAADVFQSTITSACQFSSQVPSCANDDPTGDQSGKVCLFDERAHQQPSSQEEKSQAQIKCKAPRQSLDKIQNFSHSHKIWSTAVSQIGPNRFTHFFLWLRILCTLCLKSTAYFPSLSSGCSLQNVLNSTIISSFKATRSSSL